MAGAVFWPLLEERLEAILLRFAGVFKRVRLQLGSYLQQYVLLLGFGLRFWCGGRWLGRLLLFLLRCLTWVLGSYADWLGRVFGWSWRFRRLLLSLRRFLLHFQACIDIFIRRLRLLRFGLLFVLARWRGLCDYHCLLRGFYFGALSALLQSQHCLVMANIAVHGLQNELGCG